MAFLDSFRDLLNKSALFEIEASIKDPVTGEITKGWTTEQTVSAGFWTDKSIETDINDKFKDDAIGKIVVDPAELTFTPTIKHRATIDSVVYFIEGVDNIADQDEVYLLTYRKENG